jgi:hypothetical protein
MNDNWESFKRELHKGREKYGAQNIDIVSDESGIYAEFVNSENNRHRITKKYSPSMLDAETIEKWREMLQMYALSEAFDANIDAYINWLDENQEKVEQDILDYQAKKIDALEMSDESLDEYRGWLKKKNLLKELNGYCPVCINVGCSVKEDDSPCFEYGLSLMLDCLPNCEWFEFDDEKSGLLENEAYTAKAKEQLKEAREGNA